MTQKSVDRILSSPQRKWIKPALWLLGFAGIGTAIAVIYRWAEPKYLPLPGTIGAMRGRSYMRLEKTEFAGSVAGVKNWSLWADSVEVEKLPNSGFSQVQNATLSGIRNGVLYDIPLKTTSPQLTPQNTSGTPSPTAINAPAGKPYAKFQADNGKYALGAFEAPPSDLGMTHTVQWYLRLSGNVVFSTVNGDSVKAPSLTIYHLQNKRTAKMEQRIVCEEGAEMVRNKMRLRANRLRFSPKEQQVECLEGVRVSYERGAVQTDRVFWNMKDGVLRCPDTASSNIEGIELQGENLTIDTKNRVYKAQRFHARIPIVEHEGQAMIQTKTMGAVAITAFALANPTLSQQPPKGKTNTSTVKLQEKRKPEGRKGKWFEVDGINLVTNKRTGITTADDSLVLIPEDKMRITGDRTIIDENKKTVDVAGKLEIDDPEQNVKGVKAFIDDNNDVKKAIITGNVVILIKPKKEKDAEKKPNAAADDPKDDELKKGRNEGVLVKCDKVENFYKREFIILTGNLVFTQKITTDKGRIIERTLKASKAEYDRKTEKLYLFGPVTGSDSDGQQFDTDSDAVVGTKEGEETLEIKGRFKASIFVEDKDEDPDTASKKTDKK